MRAISYLLDPVSGEPANEGDDGAENQEITTIRRRPRLAERPTTVTVGGGPPAVAVDEDACSAFDRRPPLELMGTLWLPRASVVTVYDLGREGDDDHAVYDAVFRLQGYVWIRSPGPVLRDDDLD